MVETFLRTLAEEIRKSHPIPPESDQFNPELLPFAKPPSFNNLHLYICATCGKKPTETGLESLPMAFLFRDETSAREYVLSAMCQSCQDEAMGVYRC